jgi:alkylation response protein AidB-like acyl-CoA dehydrogenase
MPGQKKRRRRNSLPQHLVKQHWQVQRLIGEAYANMSAGRALLYQTAASMDLG